MRKYGYLVVEGPHDVAFASRLLKPFGLELVQYKTQPKPKDNQKTVLETKLLDNFFYPLIPKEFPPDGDLLKRMPVPAFLQSETHVIAICSAEGDSQLVNLMINNATKLDLELIMGVGVLLDSDKKTPNERYSGFKKELLTKLEEKDVKLNLQENIALFKLPNKIGEIKEGKLNLGVFVLPDNQTAGTLENLLLESAEQVYPELLKIARNYVSEAKDKANLKLSDLKELKNAGENKAIIGAMANIFKPGKSIQVSIQDNDWLKRDALEIDRIKAVQTFLQTLFEL